MKNRNFESVVQKIVVKFLSKTFFYKVYIQLKEELASTIRDNLKNYPSNEEKLKYVNTSISKCRQANMLHGTIGPTIIGLLATLLPRYGELWKPSYYYLVIACIFLLFVYKFTRSVLLQHALETINNEEILKQFKEDLEEKDKKIKELSRFLLLTQKDLERKQTLFGIHNRIATRRDIEHPHDVITDYLLKELGDGEYSVALYVYNSSAYTVDSYQSSRSCKFDPPDAYHEIKNFTEDPHRKYFINKYMKEQKQGKQCLSDKSEIRQKFKGIVNGINQYACCSLVQSVKKCFLLELIAYNETCFNHCTDQQSLEVYIEEIIKEYMPIIQLYLDIDVLTIPRAKYHLEEKA